MRAQYCSPTVDPILVHCLHSTLLLSTVKPLLCSLIVGGLHATRWNWRRTRCKDYNESFAFLPETQLPGFETSSCCTHSVHQVCIPLNCTLPRLVSHLNYGKQDRQNACIMKDSGKYLLWHAIKALFRVIIKYKFNTPTVHVKKNLYTWIQTHY